DGVLNVYQKLSSGAESEELLLRSNADKYPSSWSPDGRFLLYEEKSSEDRSDIWLLPLEGERKPRPFLHTEFDQRMSRFSPDGRWVAYQSNESGRNEIYVRRFSETGGETPSKASGKWQISTGGGEDPKWRGNGRELFYLTPDLRLMAVDVKATANGFAAGLPRLLFQTTSIGRYAVTANGERFLINSRVEPMVPSPLTIMINWYAGLKR